MREFEILAQPEREKPLCRVCGKGDEIRFVGSKLMGVVVYDTSGGGNPGVETERYTSETEYWICDRVGCCETKLFELTSGRKLPINAVLLDGATGLVGIPKK